MRYADGLIALVGLTPIQGLTTPRRLLLPKVEAARVRRWFEAGGVRYWRSPWGDHWLTPHAGTRPDPMAADLGAVPRAALWTFHPRRIVLPRRLHLTRRGHLRARTARWLYRVLRRKRIKGRCYHISLGVGNVAVLHCLPGRYQPL